MLDLYLDDVQEKIGYRFKNLALLKQAFISMSVTEASYGRVQNYQVLEFIGDAVLSLAVVKNLVKDTCSIDSEGQLVCSSSEGKLSVQKQDLVKNETLSHCSQILGFDACLERYHGHLARDRNNKRGDLVESVLGAVAVDCDWNMDVISCAAKKILCCKNILVNYEESLRRHCFKKKLSAPVFSFASLESGDVECSVAIEDSSRVFRGRGANNIEARNASCAAACRFLEKKSATDSLSKLNNLVQSKKLPHVQFCFTLRDDGKEKEWKCEARLEGTQICALGVENTKLQAKRNAAQSLLDMLLDGSFDFSSNCESVNHESADFENAVHGQGLLVLAQSLSSC